MEGNGFRERSIMAISYIATASVENVSSGSSIISVPTGTSNGHVMVAFVAVRQLIFLDSCKGEIGVVICQNQKHQT